jgi:TatD DNase family protein
MYVDSHAHLDGPRFDADREAVLARARQAGVHTILCIGNGAAPGSFGGAITLADACPGIFASVGIHPHEAAEATEASFAELARLAQHPRVIAWGEIGLDYHYEHSPRDVQQRVMVRQLELARAARLPVVIHCRPSQGSENAWEDALALLRRHWASSGLGGILHCFTGEVHHMQAAVELGFLVSFSGALTFPRSDSIRASAQACPADRLLIETDSPYLAPVPLRGQRNEPAYVVHTAATLAALRGISREAVAALTSANFFRFFGLDPGSP